MGLSVGVQLAGIGGEWKLEFGLGDYGALIAHLVWLKFNRAARMIG